jgi:hypothetical protein
MKIDNLTQKLYSLHLFQPITRSKKHIALEIELLHVKAQDKQKYPMVEDNTQMVELESSKVHSMLTNPLNKKIHEQASVGANKEASMSMSFKHIYDHPS